MNSAVCAERHPGVFLSACLDGAPNAHTMKTAHQRIWASGIQILMVLGDAVSLASLVNVNHNSDLTALVAISHRLIHVRTMMVVLMGICVRKTSVGMGNVSLITSRAINVMMVNIAMDWNGARKERAQPSTLLVVILL